MFFFSSRRRHTRFSRDWSSDVCSSDLNLAEDYEAAYKASLEGIARDEFGKELYLFAGKLAMKLGHTEDGVKYLREAIALDPEYKIGRASCRERGEISVVGV